MSLKTWKKEFYPIPADKCPKSKAIAHSLQKWTGALKKNLKKHGCFIAATSVDDDDDRLLFGIDTCAACQHYLHGDRDCSECPLYIVRD